MVITVMNVTTSVSYTVNYDQQCIAMIHCLSSLFDIIIWLCNILFIENGEALSECPPPYSEILHSIQLQIPNQQVQKHMVVNYASQPVKISCYIRKHT